MRAIFERIRLEHCGSVILEGKGKNGLERFKAQHGIVSEKASPEHAVHSIGFSEREQKWYGWSHRAICGFGVGDKVFDPEFGDDRTPFVKHGARTIRTMDDAKQAAKAFADDVS